MNGFATTAGSRRNFFASNGNEQPTIFDKITVAIDFLDRAGFKPTDNVKVSAQVNNPFEGLSTEDLKKLIDSE